MIAKLPLRLLLALLLFLVASVTGVVASSGAECLELASFNAPKTGGQLSPLLQRQTELSKVVNRQAAVVDRWLGSSSNKWAELYRANPNSNFAKGIRGRFLDIRTRPKFEKLFDDIPGVRIDQTILGSGNRLRPDLFFPDIGGRSVIFDVGGATKVNTIFKYQGMADDLIPLIPTRWVP